MVAKKLIPYVIFILVFLVHFNSRIITSFDSKWSINIAISIIREGNFDLDEYAHLMGPSDYQIETVNEHIYSIYPYGTPLLAVPVVWIIDWGLTNFFSMDLQQLAVDGWFMGHIEVFVASIIVGITTVFIFNIVLLITQHVAGSIILAFVFAFGTSAWSTASLGLWQHGPSMLMLSAALYLILISKTSPKLIQFASIPLAAAFIIRPTNAIPVIILTIYVFANCREYLARYLLWSLPLAVYFLFQNIAIYGTWLSPYYQPSQLGTLSGSYWYVLSANLISPNRGLFIFSPFLLFGLAGFLSAKRNQFGYYLIAILVFHWLAISSLRHWWGGWQFGPRFFTDLLPFMFYFVAYSFRHILAIRSSLKMLSFAVFSVLALFSILVHYRGANNYSVYEWHQTPIDIDTASYRVFDWSDIQFLR